MVQKSPRDNKGQSFYTHEYITNIPVLPIDMRIYLYQFPHDIEMFEDTLNARI